jgi:hypothetical protein
MLRTSVCDLPIDMLQMWRQRCEHQPAAALCANKLECRASQTLEVSRGCCHNVSQVFATQVSFCCSGRFKITRLHQSDACQSNACLLTVCFTFPDMDTAPGIRNDVNPSPVQVQHTLELAYATANKLSCFMSSDACTSGQAVTENSSKHSLHCFTTYTKGVHCACGCCRNLSMVQRALMTSLCLLHRALPASTTAA